MVLEHFQDLVSDLIDDWGSDIIFTPKTHSDTYGGYSGSESNNTTDRITTKGLPVNLLSRSFALESFGNVEEGTSFVAIPAETDLESGTDYDVSWNGQTYELDKISKRGNFENITYNNAFKVVTLKKQI